MVQRTVAHHVAGESGVRSPGLDLTTYTDDHWAPDVAVSLWTAA